MNKKDLADIRKEFKINSYMLKIKQIYSVYLKKDNAQIIIKEKLDFNVESDEVKELYLNNFKKVLTGSIDSRIFELPFKSKNTVENLEKNDNLIDSQQILYNTLKSDGDISELVDQFVDKIGKNFNYDNDIVINFVRAEYYKADKKENNDSDLPEDPEEYVQAIDFILCSINKVDVPKKVLKFDYSEMKFKSNSILDLTINLNSPLDGFMFPSFCSEYVDVNKLLYYSSKSSQVNANFVENILECDTKPSASEEKESFNAIIETALGTAKPNVIQNMYESIYEKLDLEDDEDVDELTFDMKDVSQVLGENGVENTEVVKNAFEEVCGGNFNFKVKNVIPDFEKKSIKIENDAISIAIPPDMLSNIKQIRNKEGKKCLLIELSDDILINGIKLQTEKE